MITAHRTLSSPRAESDCGYLASRRCSPTVRRCGGAGGERIPCPESNSRQAAGGASERGTVGHAASPLPPFPHPGTAELPPGPRRALPLISGLPLASTNLVATPLSAVPRNAWALIGAPYEVTGLAGERKGDSRVVCFDCQSASVRSWISR